LGVYAIESGRYQGRVISKKGATERSRCYRGFWWIGEG
jgi:hypothetical protein